MSFKIIRQTEQETERKMGVIIIMDLDGFSMDLLYTPTLKVYMSLLTMLQVLFIFVLFFIIPCIIALLEHFPRLCSQNLYNQLSRNDVSGLRDGIACFVVSNKGKGICHS